MGAGLAEPDTVFLVTVPLLMVLLPEVAVEVTVVTDNLAGRGVEVLPLNGFLCGILDGVVSSTITVL